MAMREELDRLVEEMVTKGIRYEEAQREFEKRSLGNRRCHVLARLI